MPIVNSGDCVGNGKFKIMQKRVPHAASGAEPGELVAANIGEGSYGCVLLGEEVATGRPCALKIFKAHTAGVNAQLEVQILQKLQSELPIADQAFFARLLDFSLLGKPFPFLALEFGGPSLWQALRSGPVTPRPIGLQLQAALRAMHKKGIVHLDLKPANILWTEEAKQLKVVDFGMAELIPKLGEEPAWKARFEIYTSGSYRAPEIWCCSEDELRKHLLRPEVDIWAYGCVLYECETSSILMQGTRSCKRVIEEWCRSWNLLRGGKASLHGKTSEADQLVVRFQKCRKTWRDKVLQCLSPDPNARRWPNLIGA